MLKVTLDVNGIIINEFFILNVGKIGTTKRQRRKYGVTYREDGREKEFYIFHYRKDGAHVLVKKVLEKYVKIKGGRKDDDENV